MSRTGASGPVRIVHLFPELLNLYGDRGNITALAKRARWRGFDVEIRTIDARATASAIRADIIFIGGGPDHMQVRVARTLARMEGSLARAVSDGAALLAVCGGFQNLGYDYRSPRVGTLAGPGLFDASTEAPDGGRRMVGGVVVKLPDGSPIAAAGQASALAAGFAGQERTLVGFENHSGRTFLGQRVRPLGDVGHGHGNNGLDGGEGVIALPGEAGVAGLRIGTYLHGPLLPRNPHLADFILMTVLSARGFDGLSPLRDDAEWAGHAAFADRWRGRSRERWIPRQRVHRIIAGNWAQEARS
jgi:CobQ-like glutamine amidotransferase family enzyme